MLCSILAACAVAVSPSTGDNDGGGAASNGDDASDTSEGGSSSGDDGGGQQDLTDSGGASQDAAKKDSGLSSASTCAGYATPSQSAGCSACNDGGSACQPNGCYGGYYCKLSTSKCSPKPSGC